MKGKGHFTHWGAFHLAKFPVKPVEMQMERAVPVEIFRNTWKTFGAAPLFLLPFHLHHSEIFPAIFNVLLWAGAHWLSCKLTVIVKMAEMALREGKKMVGLQEDAQKDYDEGTWY